MEKCKACGYDNSYNIELSKRVGDEEFVKIDGNFTTTSDDFGGIRGTGVHKVILLGCPKCYTIMFRIN